MGIFNKKTKEINIISPINGEIKDLSKVDDEVFAGEMIGKGVAVVPRGTTITSPIDGNVKMAFPTGHAYGVSHKNGPEVLIHVGIDTVALSGKGFNSKVSTGNKIKSMDPLVEIDLEYIEKNAKSADVIVIVTNETFGEYKISNIKTGSVKAGDTLFTLTM